MIEELIKKGKDALVKDYNDSVKCDFIRKYIKTLEDHPKGSHSHKINRLRETAISNLEQLV